MKQLKTLLSGRMGPVLVIVLSIALGASLAMNFLRPSSAYSMDNRTASQTPSRAALHELQDAFSSIAEEVLPSVVSIVSTKTVTMRSMNPFFGDGLPFAVPGMPSAPQQRQAEAFGSGVIVTADGYILTNDHVVGGADKVTVTLKDGRTFEGKVIRDPLRDLALVKIDAKGLQAAKLGDSGKVRVGSWAIAVGSPFGLDQTVTVGVVSAMGRQAMAGNAREARSYYNLIQTDASINPGNSGGPLVNIDGEVIGINTLIRSDNGSSIGIGMAIPANSAKNVLKQLIANGKVVRGYLGVAPDNLTPNLADRYGVKEGALVRSVLDGSAADKGGVKVEDVIVEIDGKKIKSETDLRETVEAIKPGSKVPVVVVREKTRKPLSVTVGEMPGIETSQPESHTNAGIGLEVTQITPDIAQQLGTSAKQGVVIKSVTPGSSADNAGVATGMIILKINEATIKDVADFEAATKSLKSGDTVRMIVSTSDRKALIDFSVD